MILANRPWLPSLLLSFCTASIACATASSEMADIDAATGTGVVLPAGDAAHDGGVVIVGASSSGLPSITVTSDGGRSTLNPDGGSDADATTTGFDGSADDAEFDAAFDSAVDSGVDSSFDSAAPGMDAGTGVGSSSSTGSGYSSGSYHHHHDAGFGSSSATGTGSGSGTATGAPTDCTAADGPIGCCSGNTNYYCNTDTSTKVQSTVCPSGTVCGWGMDNTGATYYGCVEGTKSESDPSGTYPIACE